MKRSDRERIAQTLRQIAEALHGLMRELTSDSEMEHNVRSLYVAKAGVLRTADKLAAVKAPPGR